MAGKKTATTSEKPVAEKPVVEKTPVKKTVAKKAVEKEPVVEPVKEVVKESVEDSNEKDGRSVIADLVEKVANLSTNIKLLQSSLKMVAKEFDKQKKIVDKVQMKKEKAKKSPSGFAKPCKISDQLCEFIGVEKGTELSRTDITRSINSYVKEHNLNNPENRREFFPDAKLKGILNIKNGEKVTYFILQRLIAHHFPSSQNKQT